MAKWEGICTECARLRAEAANSAAQRDEAEKRATQAEERMRAVEADLALVSEWAAHWTGVIADANEARDELARIRAADRTSITAEAKTND